MMTMIGIQPVALLRPSKWAVAPWLVCIALTVAASSTHAQEAPSLPVVGISHLPHDLTPWSMFVNADGVVQTVILGLAFASLVTWTVLLAKSIEVFYARRTLRRSLDRCRAS